MFAPEADSVVSVVGRGPDLEGPPFGIVHSTLEEREMMTLLGTICL